MSPKPAAELGDGQSIEEVGVAVRRPRARTVSVIVPTKNRSAMLREALESIVALRGPDLDLEIIVADNHSTDDTCAVAESLGAFVVEAEHPGAGAARNAGLAAATGDYLAFLDDDDVFLPGHLRPHIHFLEQHPDFDVVIGQVVNADFDLANRGPGRPDRLPTDGDLFQTFLRLQPQIGATVTRASVRQDVPWFDETLVDVSQNVYASDEDWDWHMRLALSFRVGFVPVECVLFRQRLATVDAELVWRRMKFTRRVLLANITRSGDRRPSVGAIAGILAAHRGLCCSQLMRAAEGFEAAHDHRSARRSAFRALLASPPHAARELVHHPRLFGILRPQRRS